MVDAPVDLQFPCSVEAHLPAVGDAGINSLEGVHDLCLCAKGEQDAQNDSCQSFTSFHYVVSFISFSVG